MKWEKSLKIRGKVLNAMEKEKILNVGIKIVLQKKTVYLTHF